METRTTRWALGVILGVSLTLLGMAVGALIAGQVSRGGMGWDGIADALGGMLLGAPAGLLLAILLARRLRVPTLRLVTAVTGVLAASLLLIGVLRVRSDMDRAAREAAPTRPLTPTTTDPPR